MHRCLLWCGYAGSSSRVKTETDSNDAMEIKTEADWNEITQYLPDDLPTTGMFCVSVTSFIFFSSLYDMYRVCIAFLLLLLCVL